MCLLFLLHLEATVLFTIWVVQYVNQLQIIMKGGRQKVELEGLENRSFYAEEENIIPV